MATASPTGGTVSGSLIAGAPGANGTVVVIERGAGATPYPFALQVTC